MLNIIRKHWDQRYEVKDRFDLAEQTDIGHGLTFVIYCSKRFWYLDRDLWTFQDRNLQLFDRRYDAITRTTIDSFYLLSVASLNKQITYHCQCCTKDVGCVLFSWSVIKQWTSISQAIWMRRHIIVFSFVNFCDYSILL